MHHNLATTLRNGTVSMQVATSLLLMLVNLDIAMV